MGQKINPIGFRLAVNKEWRSKWIAAGKDYAAKLHEDIAIRAYLRRNLQSAAAELNPDFDVILDDDPPDLRHLEVAVRPHGEAKTVLPSARSPRRRTCPSPSCRIWPGRRSGPGCSNAAASS